MRWYNWFIKLLASYPIKNQTLQPYRTVPWTINLPRSSNLQNLIHVHNKIQHKDNIHRKSQNSHKQARSKYFRMMKYRYKKVGMSNCKVRSTHPKQRLKFIAQTFRSCASTCCTSATDAGTSRPRSTRFIGRIYSVR